MPTTNLQLPHLLSFCKAFELRTSRYCRDVNVASKKWALQSGFIDEDERRRIPGLQLALLASLSNPTCDMAQLLLVTQFLILHVHWIDKTPESGDAAFNEIWSKLVRTTTTSWHARFQHHLSAFRSARALVVVDNEHAVVPDLESYVALRQDSAGVKMLFDLIEYAEGLRIPDKEYSLPVLRQLRHGACNIVAWLTDIASFAYKHARGDSHNLVVVLMAERRLPMQSAMHAAGTLVKETVDTFLANERLLSAEPVSADVRRYVQGLRDWIVGTTHWLYETNRFFGDNGDDVRDLGWVFLSS